MPLVTVKTKFQVTIPRKLREQLDIDTGDLLEAEIQDGKIVLTPKTVVDREAQVAELRAIAERAEARWRARGLSDEDIEKMIDAEVAAVRYGTDTSS